MAESVVIQSKIREAVKARKPEFRISEEFLEELSTKVLDTVDAAVARCEKNGRKTLQPQDL
jgi:histone H3/H4